MKPSVLIILAVVALALVCAGTVIITGSTGGLHEAGNWVDPKRVVASFTWFKVFSFTW